MVTYHKSLEVWLVPFRVFYLVRDCFEDVVLYMYTCFFRIRFLLLIFSRVYKVSDSR